MIKEKRKMTKEEFYNEMLELKNELIDINDNLETFHIAADNLMCDLLIRLGYDQGVEVFEYAEKWYS